ncbi:MAG: mechanosensitive ion channel family protein [Candidatus Rokuibacteriota bacterium]
MRPILIAGSLLLSLFLAGPVFGQAAKQPPDKPAAEAPPPGDLLGRDTPQGALLGFIRAAESENYERAAQYLDSRASPREAPELARKLKAVVDRRLRMMDIDRLSPKPEGRLDDGLPPNLERVGEVRVAGEPVAIILERVERRGQAAVWLVSSRTVSRVPMLHRELELSWVERLMPQQWREFRILTFPLWQWVLFLLAIPIVLALAWALDRLTLKGLHPLLHRLTGARADVQLTKVTAPLRLLTGAVALASWASITALPLLTRVFWIRVAVAVAIVGIAWLLFRLADIIAELTETRLRHVNQIGRLAAVQLARRLAKAAVVLLGVLAVLSLAGLDLTAALAGLGIGGIALAFAAQRTLENLFGGITIISDQPVRVGDFCRIGDVTGVVEDIGLRSTRVRTLDRTVVSIPNGQMVVVNVENFGVRDKIRFRPTLSLRHETSAEQLRYVLAEIRQVLYGHPMVETYSSQVRFVRFGASSLDLEIFAYVLTSDYTTFQEVQEDLLLRIMGILEASGTAIAVPSSTTYLARDGGLDKERAQAAIATVKRWREAGDLPFPNWRPERIAEITNRLEYPPGDSALATGRDRSGR